MTNRTFGLLLLPLVPLSALGIVSLVNRAEEPIVIECRSIELEPYAPRPTPAAPQPPDVT